MSNHTCVVTLCLLASMFVSACTVVGPLQLRDGELKLNQRLRHDMGPSESMADARFFGDGRCPSLPNSHDCNFVSQVRGSLLTKGEHAFTNRLRISDFLWVAGGNGFPILSYEFVGENLLIVDSDDHSKVTEGPITVGTCSGFPGVDPESRSVVLERSRNPDGDAFVKQFDVFLRECKSLTSQYDGTGALTPVGVHCSEKSVRELYGKEKPSPPQYLPFCLVDWKIGTLDGDVSYSLKPDLNDSWAGVNDEWHELLPHLKTVQIGEARTISRPLSLSVHSSEDDSSDFYEYEWAVDIDTVRDRWKENFSPNIYVARARVRSESVTENAPVDLPIRRLRIGNETCHADMDDDDMAEIQVREYDITLCRAPEVQFFRVTPAYKHEFIKAERITDGLRLMWEIRIDKNLVTPEDDQLILELDLAVEVLGDGTAYNRNKLFAAPAARDLGELRTGPYPAVKEGFRVRNYSPSSVRVESVSFEDADAPEFGTPSIRMAGAPVTPPQPQQTLNLPAGSSIEIGVQPTFQNVGRKHTNLVLRYRGISDRPEAIYLPVYASAVSPFLEVIPERVYFSAASGPSPTGASQAQRTVTLLNVGSTAFDRTEITIFGPQASSFRVLSSVVGTTLSDLSQPVELTPGTGEFYRLGFYPETTGDSLATMSIGTTEGQLLVELLGHCVEHCQQPERSSGTSKFSPSNTVGEPVHLYLKPRPGKATGRSTKKQD